MSLAKLLLITLFSQGLLLIFQVQASEISYEEIVEDLNHQNSLYYDYPESQSPYGSSWEIHGGLSLATSYLSLKGLDGLFLSGLELAIGTSFYNSSWNLEGSYRNFSDILGGSNSSAKINEYDIKVFYATEINYFSRIKFGTGVASRFLTIKNKGLTIKEQNPSLLLFVGYDYFFTPHLSLGGELSNRRPLIASSLEQQALDLGIRIDTHF